MERRSVRVLVVTAAAVPIVMDGVYMGLIRSQAQSPPDTATVPAVVAALLVMAAVLGVSLLDRLNAVVRTTLRAAAAAALAVFGFLSGFSIGVPLLLAGAIAAVACGLSVERSRWPASLAAGIAAAVMAGALVLVGLDGVQRIVVCPPHGTYEVEGAGIVLGPYHYRCVDGELRWLSG